MEINYATMEWSARRITSELQEMTTSELEDVIKRLTRRLVLIIYANEFWKDDIISGMINSGMMAYTPFGTLVITGTECRIRFVHVGSPDIMQATWVDGLYYESTEECIRVANKLKQSIQRTVDIHPLEPGIPYRCLRCEPDSYACSMYTKSMITDLTRQKVLIVFTDLNWAHNLTNRLYETREISFVNCNTFLIQDTACTVQFIDTYTASMTIKRIRPDKIYYEPSSECAAAVESLGKLYKKDICLSPFEFIYPEEEYMEDSNTEIDDFLKEYSNEVIKI